jgi:hypothetical protein
VAPNSSTRLRASVLEASGALIKRPVRRFVCSISLTIENYFLSRDVSLPRTPVGMVRTCRVSLRNCGLHFKPQTPATKPAFPQVSHRAAQGWGRSSVRFPDGFSDLAGFRRVITFVCVRQMVESIESIDFIGCAALRPSTCIGISKCLLLTSSRTAGASRGSSTLHCDVNNEAVESHPLGGNGEALTHAAKNNE